MRSTKWLRGCRQFVFLGAWVLLLAGPAAWATEAKGDLDIVFVRTVSPETYQPGDILEVTIDIAINEPVLTQYNLIETYSSPVVLTAFSTASILTQPTLG